MTQLAPSPVADLLTVKRDEILRLAAHHGASNVRVFGSVVRGEATSKSDIDLLVKWDYERISSWGGVGLSLDLEELLGRKVDVVSEDGLHWYIRDRVLAEAVPL
jgi:hypothetical protein